MEASLTRWHVGPDIQRRQINSISAYVLQPTVLYRLNVRTRASASGRDEWSFKLIRDQHRDSQCMLHSHEPSLTLNDGFEEHSVIRFGQTITLWGQQENLSLRIDTAPTNCDLCNAVRLRIELIADCYFDLYLERDYSLDISIVLEQHVNGGR